MFIGRKKKCQMYTLQEFEEFIEYISDGKVTVSADLEGLTFMEGDDICDLGEIHEMIGNFLELEVTSIHIDDADVTGVWVVYK